MVSENTVPPVCKLIDYGQYKYKQQKKEKKSRKSSKSHVIKEIKMSPKISGHDFQIRVNKGLEFLKKGYKIKLLIPFRGREIIHPELGEAVAKKFIESVKEIGQPEHELTRAHRSMVVIIQPK